MSVEKSGRRELQFDSLDDMLAEAKKLVEAQEADAETVVSTGNWTLAQALMHLALGMRVSMDGAGKFKQPFLLKFIGPVIKRRILKKGMKPGYQLPEKQARLFVPKDRTKLSSAWDAFQRQTDRLRDCENFQPHPAFGEMTREEWLKFTLRHAELHLSFHRTAT